jgi:hypothetical protein
MAVAAAGCGRSAKPLAEVFPRELEGWRLARMEAVPLENAPPDIRRLGAREAARASYVGRGAVELTLYDMTNRKSAYAALRLARESAGSVAFYHDRYFGVVESPGADRAALAAFSSAFEKRLAGGR